MAAIGRSGSGAAPGRTVTLAGFLLGTVSGSGVATTVMLGSVVLAAAAQAPATVPKSAARFYPPPASAPSSHRRRSAPRRSSSPSSCRSRYLQVLVMATIPTILYYLSIFLMIEADSRRLGTRAHAADVEPARSSLPEVRLSLLLAGRDCRLHGRRHVGVSRRLLGDGACRWTELPAARNGAHAAPAPGGARVGSDGCPRRVRHDGHRRHHRRHRHADRAWA